jgi:phage terminase small subunit
MSEPLKNLRREAFCQHYAGDCWGNAAEAYRRSGYAPKAAQTCGPRMLTFGEVKARVAELRAERIEAMAVDRAWIMEKRKRIAENGEPADQLRALEQLERSLGLATPERVQVEHSGQTGHVHRIEVAPDSWETLQRYIAEIAAMPIPAVPAEAPPPGVGTGGSPS